MQLLETSIEVKTMKLSHPHTYGIISNMSPDELIGCWVNLREDKGPHEWSGLMRFYRDHVLGVSAGYSVHGYLWLRLNPLAELWKAWGFSVTPDYEIKPLKHAPGRGMEWEVMLSGDSVDEVLAELNDIILRTKHSGTRAISVLQQSGRRCQLASQGVN